MPTKKRGRPRTQIDYTEVERLAEIACTHEEIAHALNVGLSTLEHDPEFKEVYQRGFTRATESLRRAQLAAALEGNVTAQIWLGKNVLHQSDKPLPDEEENGALEEVLQMFLADCEAFGV